MKSKKFLHITLWLTAICLMLVAIFNYIIDPFYYYHLPYAGMQYLCYGEMQQNLNLARNAKYDTLITGTSMCENFRVSWFDNKYDCNAIKLTFAGGHTKDFTQLFDQAFSSGNQINKVFFGIDIYTLISDLDTTRFQYDDYQVSSNPLYDVEYLLNKDVTIKYSYTSLGHSLDHYNEPTSLGDDLYVWDSDSVQYGREAVLSNYSRPDIQQRDSDNGYGDIVDLNLSRLEKYIQDNPATEFYLFYPPYSILYWDTMIRHGEVNSQILTLEKATKDLLNYPNVKVFSFITDPEIITNLNNYKDYTHYRSSINQFMLDQFEQQEYLLTKDNYYFKFESFKDFILSFDYEQYFDK